MIFAYNNFMGGIYMSKIRRMFPGGNTANGFYSFHGNIICGDRKKLYILKGMPGGGKSSLMKEVGKKALEKGFSLEYHHCPSDPNSIDGIHIEELKVAIVDGTAPHIIDPIYPGLEDQLIDLGIFIDSSKLYKNKEKIYRGKLNNKIAYSRAYNYFKAARIIYDIIVENNKNGMDYTAVNRESLNLMKSIFYEKNGRIKESKIRHMFAAANTPDGYVDFSHTILEDLTKIYYIEGHIGTGKSTLLKRIIEMGEIKGYSMEIYHNPTMPEKIETIIIRELNMAITSNKKAMNFSHEKINLNKYLDIEIINDSDYKIYGNLIKEGIGNLKLAKENHKILEESYKTSIDYRGVDQIKKKIIEEIFIY